MKYILIAHLFGVIDAVSINLVKVTEGFFKTKLNILHFGTVGVDTSKTIIYMYLLMRMRIA